MNEPMENAEKVRTLMAIIGQQVDESFAISVLESVAWDVEQAVATSASVVAAELAWCETSLEKMRKAARHWKKQYDTLKEAKA